MLLSKRIFAHFSLVVFIFSIVSCAEKEVVPVTITKESRIVLLGNNLVSRMQNFGHFETEMHLRYPENNLFIRNMGDGGNTPGFRPHASRNSPWAFEGAEKFQTELAKDSGSEGSVPSPDEWLFNLKADIIIAFSDTMNLLKVPRGLKTTRMN